jgi:hypothetical protein
MMYENIFKIEHPTYTMLPSAAPRAHLILVGQTFEMALEDSVPGHR